MEAAAALARTSTQVSHAALTLQQDRPAESKLLNTAVQLAEAQSEILEEAAKALQAKTPDT